ncbi:hypothetical protein BDV26DRAFT_213318 [Aspergillus bertholletiae]|uniref:Uncharacterized protein n=1 Tax=Aspergillus bertholletiae TaxID=1226010 RepID=A0A5N7B686_9EURO|nr:hypothetical protein BDV26DRAFT_213318 [Aspergillus bertholletiae]
MSNNIFFLSFFFLYPLIIISPSANICQARFTGSWHLVAGPFVNMGLFLTKHLRGNERMSADCFGSFVLNGSSSLFLLSLRDVKEPWFSVIVIVILRYRQGAHWALLSG